MLLSWFILKVQLYWIQSYRVTSYDEMPVLERLITVLADFILAAYLASYVVTDKLGDMVLRVSCDRCAV